MPLHYTVQGPHHGFAGGPRTDLPNTTNIQHTSQSHILLKLNCFTVNYTTFNKVALYIEQDSRKWTNSILYP